MGLFGLYLIRPRQGIALPAHGPQAHHRLGWAGGRICTVPPGAGPPNPKPEARYPRPTQIPNSSMSETPQGWVVLVISALLLWICFGFRASGFGFMPGRIVGLPGNAPGGSLRSSVPLFPLRRAAGCPHSSSDVYENQSAVCTLDCIDCLDCLHHWLGRRGRRG